MITAFCSDVRELLVGFIVIIILVLHTSCVSYVFDLSLFKREGRRLL